MRKTALLLAVSASLALCAGLQVAHGADGDKVPPPRDPTVKEETAADSGGKVPFDHSTITDRNCINCHRNLYPRAQPGK